MLLVKSSGAAGSEMASLTSLVLHVLHKERLLLKTRTPDTSVTSSLLVKKLHNQILLSSWVWIEKEKHSTALTVPFILSSGSDEHPLTRHEKLNQALTSLCQRSGSFQNVDCSVPLLTVLFLVTPLCRKTPELIR